ncbi:YihY/virulence factor BrkB family protein [Actinomadura atramentaria]|uniref:YihY/virulence factor BrkB family protein n=1 Tax=Actinomadura atramentaria TaxID=1990 RepID=UPI00037DEFEB|nr:YihY/virulence factor BrkB family protein [Actinomadura atramentaria]
MPKVIDVPRRRAGELLAAARERSGGVDHLVRALERYQDRRGDRLAAALTCYGFLSFFPLVALAYALLGYAVGVSDAARGAFVDAVDSILPGLSAELRVDEIARSRATVGLVGLGALLFTGLGWVDALREALRDVWGNDPSAPGNFFVRKAVDGGVLLFLGATLLAGMAVSALAGTATHAALGWFGLTGVPGAAGALRGLSLAVAVASNALIFLVLFSRLSGTRAPWRRICRGALLGAVGFEVLKQAATTLLSRTTHNPVYASFAVLVGLMVWINLASRWALLAAAWTATRRAVRRADAAPEAVAPGHLSQQNR